MLRYPVTFLATFLAFALIDAVWLTLVAGPLYKATLGPMLLEQFRLRPALLFYAVQITGIMVFVVPRFAGSQAMWQNFLFGALFGLFTYGCFDLTCYAILQSWTFYLTWTDIAWGTVLTGSASTIGIAAGEALVRRFQ